MFFRSLLFGLPIVIFVLGMCAFLGLVYVWRLRQRRGRRESPLSREMVRPPGYSLRLKLDDLNDELTTFFIVACIAPLMIFSMHVSQSYFGEVAESATRVVVSVAISLFFVSVLAYRLFRLLDERRRYRLALDGEMFTGEELNQLLRDGCRVFHDIPFPHGNIDHVVVSRSGVYAVNTKTLQKPKHGPDRAKVTVDHNRNVIRFPDRDYRIPVDQLETESRWLSQHLSSATGREIRAESILALPGWHIQERLGRSSVFVINPTSPVRFFVQNRYVLDGANIQQVSHQLDELCRDVAPAFRERARWES